MQEWRQQERYTLPFCQSPGTHDWPRVRKSTRMNRVKALSALPGLAPHSHRYRVAWKCQRLPGSKWDHRQWLEEPSSAVHAPKRIAANLNTRVVLNAGGKTLRVR